MGIREIVWETLVPLIEFRATSRKALQRLLKGFKEAPDRRPLARERGGPLFAIAQFSNSSKEEEPRHWGEERPPKVSDGENRGALSITGAETQNEREGQRGQLSLLS